MVTGAGSAKHGGRWNPPFSFRTVYASLQPEAAMSESLAAFRYYGWAIHDAMPRVFRGLEIRLARILDLRRPEVSESLAPWLETIRREDWRATQQAGREATSQAVGRAAFHVGLEGLLVRSYASPRYINLVAFPDNFFPGSSLRVCR
jgi:RES domain-containing protein